MINILSMAEHNRIKRLIGDAFREVLDVTEIRHILRSDPSVRTDK